MDEVSEKLHNAIQKRNRLRTKRDQLEGKLESAKTRLKEVQEKCRAKKIDPDEIDSVIAKVEKVYEERVQEIVAQVEQAEKALAPYLNNTENS